MINRFAKFSWFVLGVNVFVILWGALVRATGSGAGCGSHWPSCNGQVLPTNPTIETIIEFTHRLTSGVALLLVVGMFIWAIRAYSAGSLVRRGAFLSLVFIGIEALIGAGLVLNELVADNASVVRAVTVAVHLANTFFLLGSLTLTAWWASGGKPVVLRGQGTLGWLFAVGAVSLIFLGMSGAITALGDTLFPAESLRQGIQADFSGTAHFLIELRIIHPISAIVSGIYLLTVSLVAVLQRPSLTVRRFSGLLLGLIFLQLTAGVINVVLLAPVWMQILHLFLADMLWIVFVLLSASTFTVAASQSTVQKATAVETPAPQQLPSSLYSLQEKSDGR